MKLRFTLLLLVIISVIIESGFASDSDLSNFKSDIINEDDFPICEKPFRAKLYSIVDNQLIIHIDEAAKAELFYYKLHLQGDKASEGQLDTFYIINQGHIQIVNDILINENLDVELQRVCLYGASSLEVESEWIVLKNGQGSEDRMTGDGDGIDCELFNGAQAQLHNGDWQVNLSGLHNFLTTGTVGGGSSSSGLDSLIVIFKYIDGRGDTITETMVVDSTWTQQDLKINLSNMFGFTGDEFGQIIMEIGWWSGLNSSWILCDGVIILDMGSEFSLACGDTVTMTPSTNQTGLSQLNVDDIFFINLGFPVQVTSITSSSSPNFKGEGLLTIPFKEEKLIIEFDCNINEDYWVLTGEVSQVGAPIEELEGVFVIGSATCYKTEEEWNEDGTHKETGEFYDSNGFGQDGQYILDPPYEGYEEGMPYDPDYNPCGFDSQGYYLETGEKFNEDGCTVDGVKADGSNDLCEPWPCNTPYFWLAEGDPATDEGLSLSNKYRDSLEGIIIAFIDSLIAENNDLLDDKVLCVNGKKTDLLTHAGTLGLDEELMFGEELEYISIGCSELFISEPKPLQVNIIPRNDTIVLIENTHIELYHCDKERMIYYLRDSILNEQLETENLEISINELLYLIRRLNLEEVTEFDTDYEAFVAWLNDFLDGKIQLLYAGDYSPGPFDIEDEENQGLKNFNDNESDQGEENDDEDSISQTENSEDFESGEGIDNRTNSIRKSKKKGNNSKVSQSSSSSFNSFSTERSYTENERKALQLSSLINRRIINNEIESRSSSNGIEAPITITKSLGGVAYSIILDNFRITNSGAELDAYAVIDDPNTGNKIVFSNKDIEFGLNGFSQDTMKVFLESDIELKLINPATLRILGGDGTYVYFNCDGYISSGIEAEVEFCPNYLLPVDTLTNEIIENDTARVKAKFEVQMQNWGEFTVGVDVDPFVVTDAPNLIWTIQGAELDFSDQSSPAITFPENYNSYLVAPNGTPMPEWKGFYLDELKVKMLGGVGQNSTNPINVSVQKMIIDNVGFTGQFGVGGDFVTLGDGDLGGWSFSMDTIGINIVANRLVGGGFGGKINVPILKSNPNTDNPDVEDCLNYFAAYQPDGSLSFDVNSTGSYGASVWKANLDLSRISIKGTISDEEIALEAIFSGSLTADVSESNLNFKIPELSFEDLTIRNQPNYFDPGTWKVSDSLGFSFSGMSFGLSNIGLTKEASTEYFNLDFTVSIGIGAEELTIDAKGYLSMRGKIDYVGTKQKYIYDSFNVNGFSIDTDIKDVMKVKGEIIFFENHSTYGKGFYGNIEAEMEKFGGIGMNAAAIFGTHNTGYKYFMVDVGVTFGDVGIALSPIPLSITGIGGGLYFKMERQDLLDGLPNQFNNPSTPTLGTSCSGIKYIPNNTIFMGLNANIAFIATSSKTVFNGNAELYIEFNNNNGKIGGVGKIGIDGNAQFMELPDIGKSSEFASLTSTTSPGGVMSAWISLEVNFTDKTFSGTFAAFLDAGLIHGAGTNNSLGKAEVYFGPDGWFINVGTPTERMGIALSIPGMGKVAEVKSYFCVGSKVPDIPPLPPQFSSFNSLMQQQNLQRKTGRGMAFGTSLEISTGDLTFLIFYGSFELGAGFDVMLKDYGDLVCDNNEQIGINGWYATGQVYAFIGAKIGIKVGKKKYSIIEANINAALKAQLPNPFYAVGTVGGSYRILGGLIKGSCKFNMEIGEKCTTNPEALNSDMEIIFDIYPVQDTEDFDPYDSPRIDLVIPAGKEFKNEDDKKLNLTVQDFRVLSENVLLNSGKYSLVNDGYSIKMDSKYPLIANDSITFIFKLKLSTEGSADRFISDTIGFFTGAYPDRFIPENVIATYPINKMLNFYKKEFIREQGYVKFEKSQMLLFESNFTTEPFIKLIDSVNNLVIPLEFEYDVFSNTLYYDLPSQTLVNGGYYTLIFGRTHLSGLASKPLESIDQGVSGAKTQLNEQDIIATKREDEVFHKIDFRVSMYNKFLDKINYIFENGNSIGTLPNIQIQGVEPFDNIEIGQLNAHDPLVSIIPKIEDSQFNFCGGCFRLHHTIFSGIPYEVGNGIKLEGPYPNDNYFFYEKEIIITNIGKPQYHLNNFSNMNLKLEFQGFSKIKYALDYIYEEYTEFVPNMDEMGNSLNTIFMSYTPNNAIIAGGGNHAKLIITYTLPGDTSPNTTISNRRLD